MLSSTKMALTLVTFITFSPLGFAATYLVDSAEAFNNTIKNIKAGDTVKLADGTWQNFEMLFVGQGTEDKPITLTAETKGKVVLSGNSNLRLAGQHLIVSGLVFKNGFTPSSEVIAFRKNKQELAFHSRVTEVVIEDYSNPDKQESDYWVGIYGQYNRFDHNYLVGKRNRGVTVAVRLTSEDSQQNYHKIDHNYFGPRPILGSNGGETLRIGTSHHSLTDSFTLVENNYFDRCNGEVEIISVKSGKNRLVNNTFFESRGTLTLRHGNGNIVENNVFWGNGVDHTGGIRVINKQQVIRNNYLEGLTGYRFGSGFTVMNGVPNSSINRYHQVDGALIENNSFINVEHIQLAAGSDDERSAVPINSKIQNNLIINENGKQPFTLFDDISGINFKGNISNTKALDLLTSGIKQQPIKLQRAKNSLYYPVGKTIGVDKSILPIDKNATGPTWYKKPTEEVAFGSGKTITVKANGNALIAAIKKSKNGDVLALENGHFDVTKIIKIDKVITLKAKSSKKALLTFERGTLFEIVDGGSLKIDGLSISGRNSPDSSGNTLIRTKKWGMTENYRFIMHNSSISQLNINHSFHFFDSGNGAFANLIELKNNQFSYISGDVIRLNKEIEDQGIYNAEYVTLENNQFTDIAGAVAKVYRGGTDESTFGPHFIMRNNKISNVGSGKRNKTKASLYLHGVQVTNIEDNKEVTSAPIKIEHTVGEPKTRLSLNKLSIQPLIAELHSKGPVTAILTQNEITELKN